VDRIFTEDSRWHRSGYEGCSEGCIGHGSIVGFTDALRKEFGKKNIRFICVEPGMVRTELHPRQEFENAIRSAGVEEPLESEDIASAILYCLEQPKRVTVAEITVRPATQEM
jgi:NADP-dependent 3-hydroxy acid dehydrogenase YdfG